MTIAFIGTRGYPFVYSGYETFIAELAPRLVQRGHRVIVYAHRSLFPVRPRVVNGVEVVYLPALESKLTSQFSHSLLSTLHVLFKSVDVIMFVNTANGPFGVITSLAGKRTVMNTDGLEWLRPKWRGWGAKYFYWSSRLSTRVFDVLVADSKRMAEIYEREFGASSTVIEYGANIAFSDRPEKVRALGLEPGGYYLVVGRLIPDNNGELIVRAFEQVNTRRRLVILGDVPYRDAYADRIRQTSDARIMFPGYVTDQSILKELYANSFVYVHGHEYGGTNPSLLKALAYGSCVLALDTVFNREVLDDGEYGLFFPKDVHALADCMRSIDADPETASQFRERSRKRIEQRYNWARITDEYETLFQRIILETI